MKNPAIWICAVVLGLPQIWAVEPKPESSKADGGALENKAAAMEEHAAGPKEAEKKPAPALRILMFESGDIHLDDKPVTREELYLRLKAGFKKNPNQAVRISGIKKAAYSKVVELIEICQRAGVWDLSFGTIGKAAS